MGRKCSCGSGLTKRALSDARGIFVSYVCESCVEGKKARYRPEIFSDSAYYHEEPVD